VAIKVYQEEKQEFQKRTKSDIMPLWDSFMADKDVQNECRMIPYRPPNCLTIYGISIRPLGMVMELKQTSLKGFISSQSVGPSAPSLTHIAFTTATCMLDTPTYNPGESVIDATVETIVNSKLKANRFCMHVNDRNEPCMKSSRCWQTS
jgi:hypothetical protein